MPDSLQVRLVAFLGDSGLLAFFLSSAASSALIPVPAWLVTPLGGFLASQGAFPLWQLVLLRRLLQQHH